MAHPFTLVKETKSLTGFLAHNLTIELAYTLIYTVNKKRMIKGKIEVIYLYKVFSLYIIRDYCTLKS